MNKKSIYLIIFLLLSFSLTGCFRVNRGFKKLRNIVLEETPIKFQKDIELAVGSGTLGLANIFISLSHDPEGKIASRIINQISRVQVGVYEKKYRKEENLKIVHLKKISNKIKDLGWNFLVRSVDRNEMAAVFYKDNEDHEIRRILVIGTEDNEMFIVEIMGDLNDVIEIAVNENGKFIDMHN
ncbi:MAG: DUF4252 domain-containing protein [Ignavibacteria bacterium]|jgi:hypothetical protein